MHPLSFWSLYILSPPSFLPFLSFLFFPLFTLSQREAFAKKSGETLQLPENKFLRKTQVVQRFYFAHSFLSWKNSHMFLVVTAAPPGADPDSPPPVHPAAAGSAAATAAAAAASRRDVSARRVGGRSLQAGLWRERQTYFYLRFFKKNEFE